MLFVKGDRPKGLLCWFDVHRGGRLHNFDSVKKGVTLAGVHD
jgi:hypothetical protein